MRERIKDDELIGKKFKSNSSNEFTVITLTNKKDNRMKLFEIEFDEINNTKYTCLARKEDILKGKPRNPFYPSVCGVGYLGNVATKNHIVEYRRWQKMIERCYNPNSPKYKTYGANGVSVCERWLCFENYVKDFTKIEGYDMDNLDNLQIDKDLKVAGNKIYSLKTCMFIPTSVNSMEMNQRVNQKLFVAVSPKEEVFESNNQRDFAKEHNLDYKGINAVLKKYQRTHRGWTFKYKGE